MIKQMDFEPRTSRTITDPIKLHLECERVLDLGYSIDYAEGNEGIHCIAGPIMNPDETLAGALWITGPAKRLPKSRFPEFGNKAKVAGDLISSCLEESSG